MTTEISVGQLSGLLSHASVGIIATDADGRVTLVSPALRELFALQDGESLTEEELPARLHLWDEDLQSPLLPHQTPLARSRVGEALRDVVVASRFPGRDVKYLRCNSAPLQLEDDAPAGAVALIQDATAERLVLLQQEELRHRLITTVNHELRTPLTTLLGNAEILSEEAANLSPSGQRALQAVARSGERLKELVQVVSGLAELHSGTHAVRRPTDLGLMISELVAELDGRAAERGIALRIDVTLETEVDTDADKLREALAALLDNALTHAPDDSEVIVHLCGDSTWVQLSVADRGPGIPTRDRKRLREAFERGDTTQQPVNSRGLGLAVASTVAAAHGGRLLLDHNDPQGLVATLVLPRTQVQPMTPPEPPPHIPGNPCPNGGASL